MDRAPAGREDRRGGRNHRIRARRRRRRGLWRGPAILAALILVAAVVIGALRHTGNGSGGAGRRAPAGNGPGPSAAAGPARSATGPARSAVGASPSAVPLTAPSTAGSAPGGRSARARPAIRRPARRADPVLAALPPQAEGSQPQTDTEPPPSSPALTAEMTVLWRAIRSGRPGDAMRAFFPEAAYDQLKAFWDDSVDWQDRLVDHYELDISAAHDLIAAGPTARYVTVVLPPASDIAWIPPGACYNRIGYWHAPGARLVYSVAGREHSIGVASLISWRGEWYVVHLGSVLPPVGEGVVDEPAEGTGFFSPLGGC